MNTEHFLTLSRCPYEFGNLAALFTSLSLLLGCGVCEAMTNARSNTVPSRNNSTFGAASNTEPAWFGLAEPSIHPISEPGPPPEIFVFDTGFESTEPDGYNPEEKTDVVFEDGTGDTSAEGALFGFGFWSVVVDGDAVDSQVMQVINNGVIDSGDPSDQLVRVSGAPIGHQSAGYADSWGGIDVSGQSVSLSMDIFVTEKDLEQPGLWGISLFSEADADGFIHSFGGIGLVQGDIFLSLDGLATTGASLGSVGYDEWVRLAMVFNFDSHTFDANVNDDPVLGGIPMASDPNNNIVGFGVFGQGSALGTSETAYFDNYSIALTGHAIPEPGSAFLILAMSSCFLASCAITNNWFLKA